MVPGLIVLRVGAVTVHATVESVTAGPVTAAMNCCVALIKAEAGLGVTLTVETAGGAYVAVTVAAAFMVTLQVTVVVLVHPLHDENLVPPAVAGAVSVTPVPALYV